ncbi:MAG: alanine racemase [Candidatus Omnitrophica bacterium]|nr:alanine racemase [Candidatus Omnitrophota bacterium]
MALETLSTESKPYAASGTWIEVNLDRILRNLERIRVKAGAFTRVMAVVKANAYGHGLVPVSRALEGKVDFLGIGSLKEASHLREQGIKSPLFLFGRLLPEEAPIALQMGLTLTVSSLEEAKVLSEAGSRSSKKVPIHVKVDTGMGRLGIPYESALSEIEKIAVLPWLQLEGIYTHFPTAECFPDDFTRKQLSDFEGVIQDLRRKGISFAFRHAANSAGILRFKSPHLNMVRPGISLYGIYPDSSFEPEIDLEPALCLKSRIVFLKRLSPGDSVGYGRTFIASKPTLIAVLPTGYGHGYPFVLSSKSEILYRGKRCKVAGRVCMDSMMIELEPDTEARIGDEVVLLGPDEKDRIRAEELANLAQTIPYEIVTRLDGGLPRLYRSDSPLQTD